MQDKSSPRRLPSGFQRRRRRVAQGLPPFTDAERAGRRRYDQGRGRAGYLRQLAMTDAIKLDRGCADCGYRGHPAALEFDHLPGATKIAGVAWLCSHRRRAAILAEIAKCEVVCANCHAIRTVTRRRTAAGREEG